MAAPLGCDIVSPLPGETVKIADHPLRLEGYRRQLERILASAEFAGSRQAREFLVYASDAFFEGRTHLEQVEIAARVLHRGDNFNPLDDASVRKLATLTRHRLERYYAGEGARDPVVVSLPMRSYVPQFRERESEAPGVVAAPPDELEKEQPVAVGVLAAEPVVAPPPSGMRWRVAIAALCVATAALVYAFARPRATNAEPGEFRLTTVRGDIKHDRLDLPGAGIQLGPVVGPADDVTVRMRFTAEKATQQAGLLVYDNPDRYVKLGRQFLSRADLEFGLEVGARYRKPQDTFVFDPQGQTGEPVWLSIRRRHQEYTAYLSTDGMAWRQVGNVLAMPEAMTAARVGLYAHDGRSNAPVTEARFDALSVGLEFHGHADGPLDAARLPGWELVSNCPDGANAIWRQDALEMGLGPGPGNCHTNLLRSVPAQDWVVSTKVDFLSAGGSVAGLWLQGSKGQLRLARWDLDGGSVSAEHFGHRQVNVPDFGGSPPLVLRMACRNGVVRCSFSRDGVRFRELPLAVAAAALGDRLRVGLHAGKSSWASAGALPPARFAYIRRHVEKLEWFRR